jgi:hypothetical protein
VVSLMAMVPDSEWRMPILIVSSARAGTVARIPRPSPAAPMIQRRVFGPKDIGEEGDDMDDPRVIGKR